MQQDDLDIEQTEEQIDLDDNTQADKIVPVNLGTTMKSSFLDYAMSVIVSRALPDVKDGLKPVQRRIIYGMNELNLYASSQFKKSARIVGDVMGKYHPHGDSSIYEAMVRMAQDFSYRYKLVDGHGNFGSIDGDGAAAMRYTEARMSKITMELIKDLNKDTVDFIDNYDASESEPAVLPSKFPNLLVNGASGIAVGMATKIPSHNLGEIINATIALMDNSELTDLDLMEYVKGPDFPTGGIIMGLQGIKQAYTKGKGSIIIRSKTDIVESKGKKGSSIIITEIPYMVNKMTLLDSVVNVVKEKVIEGITDIRDESNRKGLRIVIETKKEASAEVILNNLYKHTHLQTSFGINMVALVDNKPVTLTLRKALSEYIKHQVNVITRRTQYDLDKALARMHILEGLLKAIDFIDEVIKIIRGTLDGTEREKLMNRFSFSEIQAQAILDMQLKRLSGINREKTQEEYNELKEAVEEYKLILEDDAKKFTIIKDELSDIKDRFADERRTEISSSTNFNKTDRDLIAKEDIVLMVTQNGYAKRMKQSTYRNQSRGGVGVSGIKTNDSDQVEFLVPTTTHDDLLFFTNFGRAYKINAYQIPEGSKISKGMPLVNIIDFMPKEKVAAIACATTLENSTDSSTGLFFVTKRGLVKRTMYSEFTNIRKSGIIAIKLNDDDELIQVEITDGTGDIMLAASNGNAIRFSEKSIRPLGRSASGVIGMKFSKSHTIIGMTVVNNNDNDVLILTERGYAKRSNSGEFKTQSRGGTGVKALSFTSKNGSPVALRAVNNNQDMIITTDKGMVIRMPIESVNPTGRATQGVRVINLKGEQNVMNIAVVDHMD